MCSSTCAPSSSPISGCSSAESAITATVQGTDPIQDIAVVKVNDGSLPLAQFGDSTKVRVGQQVVAIGSPHGNQSSVTSGIISALHRALTATTRPGAPGEDLPDVLQTDAAINPGNSGGPLADADGNVIGVNTAMDATGQGIGYAIPSLIAKRRKAYPRRASDGSR